MIYRKQGSVARWENGTLVRVTESGVAIEDGDFFECYPEPGESVAEPSRRVVEIAESLTVRPPVVIERLIISDGIAEHECDGRTWTEESLRFHASLVRGDVRALVDSVDDVARIADALARLEPERPAPPRLRLAPNVTAALLPALVDLAPPNVALWQTGGGVDGYGRPIEETRDAWPNWYRPSYRVRPVRMPLNLRIECDVTEIDRDRPLAVALLAPPSTSLMAGDGLVLRVLVDDGTIAWPASVRITRIDAVAQERTWYPYGAGSFGAELML
jgi:hypothetical protein